MKTQHKAHIILSKEHSSKASCKKTHKGEKKEFLGQMSQPLHTILKQLQVLVVWARVWLVAKPSIHLFHITHFIFT
jgi:hypothetical protein